MQGPSPPDESHAQPIRPPTTPAETPTEAPASAAGNGVTQAEAPSCAGRTEASANSETTAPPREGEGAPSRAPPPARAESAVRRYLVEEVLISAQLRGAIEAPLRSRRHNYRWNEL